MRRPLVILESPYRGASLVDRKVNEWYARAALMDCIERGESPIASHLLYPQVLDEDNPDHRMLGIELGLDWRRVAEKAVFYTDRGISPGMSAARSVYEAEGRPFFLRSIFKEGTDFYKLAVLKK